MRRSHRTTPPPRSPIVPNGLQPPPMTLTPAQATDLLTFWFEDHGRDDWFGGGPAFDVEIRERYQSLYEAHRADDAADHLATPVTALAAILLFDQMPRNLFRDDGRAFATDPLAREIARGVLEHGWEERLTAEGRQFAYMPFMHSEDMADQDRSVALFEGLGNDEATAFAKKHRDVIARFGRFPHRNAALGRDTKPDEQEAVQAGADW